MLPEEEARQEIVAHDYRPAAFDVRQEPADERTADDEALFEAEMEARGLNRQDDLQEIDSWRQSLSPGDARDMQDMLENGAYAGAPEPTERAVLGKFTALVGDRPRLADIVHDAIEHYQPYASMVERIEHETGKRGQRSAAEDRGAKSLYNATLARRSG